MIKFFRHIRYNLVGKNKIGKYLKYAIGEIVLVVIGILIALQINVWQTDNYNRKQEHFYLEKLRHNIAQDTVYLENRLLQLENSKSVLNQSAQEVSDAKLYEFSNDSIGSFLVGVYRFTPQTSTMDNLLATGKLELIKNQDLVDSLFVYYNDLNNYTEQRNSSNEIYSRHTIGPNLMAFEGGIYGFNKSSLSIEQRNFIVNAIEVKQQINNGLVRDYRAASQRARRIINMVNINLNND